MENSPASLRVIFRFCCLPSSPPSPLVESRIQAAEAVKDKALRVKDYVSSNVAWKKYSKSVASAADAVRGYRIAKKSPAPAPGSPSSPAKKARQGARSQ
jgi:hypothetical protein